MVKEFPIPVVAGPGSQPEEDSLQYLPMPDAMTTFALPIADVEADPAVLAAACAVVEQLRDRMCAAPLGSSPVLVPVPVIELLDRDADVVRLLNQTMGEGEVSIAVRGSAQYRIQETVFASVWRVREYAADGRLVSDALMACAIPPIVRQLALDGAILECAIPEKSGGLMNSPAVLVEIAHKAATRKAGDAAHVVNLTLLPMSPADMDCLVQTLGIGTVTILSRGYGNCRIGSTRLSNVWWVQYFNSMDTLILNTLEVADVPEVALASGEDHEDSIERLGEWLQVMRATEAA
ncbi:MAG: hydrogenase expression/formation protein [Gallionella sp.]|jgi:hydrogenase-1 operon protein HyaF|nr:hydrogenase expression/formation protein [Gallionella sp.]MCK9355283.1 hydrogenase expression/formation protein [Gallionella sp.]